MKPAMLCLLLLSACSDFTVELNYRTYAVTWTCMSPEGCEHTEQVVLIDRAEIVNGGVFVEFSSTKNELFREQAQIVPSDELPLECFWLHGFSLFATEAKPSRFCRIPGEFELAMSIPNRDPSIHSEWFVEGREID